ncbi:MAG TPA: hypothetical protein VMV33_13710 [Rhodocyclaceae bacterium]|nr:hypothetical protein [Rhodocyclaceae bacterium]
MTNLGLIRGERSGRTAGNGISAQIGYAVRAAIGHGFVVGREVRIGSIAGTVIGYNIAHCGQFLGAAYPLLVYTPFGISKCGLAEVSLV